MNSKDVAAICKPLYEREPTMQKLRDMLDEETGTWEAPTVYDDLPRGIRVLVDILTECDLDARQKECAVRWVREATGLLDEIRSTKAKADE